MDFNSINQPKYETAIIMGVTKFNDAIEGKMLDTCTVFIATKFNEENGNSKGFGVAKVRFGTSVNFSRFDGVSLPTEAQVLFERVTNGSGKQTSILKDIKFSQKG